MRSTKNTRAFAVGVFIFVALVIFIIGVLTLGGQRNTFSDMITAKAVFNDINGLQTGNNVWYAGVKIGTVKKIKFTPSGQVEVTMGIEEKSQQYIRKDVKAKVGTDGLIGNRIIVLTGGTAQAPVIADGDVVRADNALNMEEMMNTLQANNKNLLDITNDFKAVSQRLASGQGTIGKLLKDESIANSLEVTLATLKRTMGQTEELTNNISDYTAKLQQKGSLSNDLVTDTVIFSRLRSSVAQIEDLSKTANEVVNTLNTTTKNINQGLSNSSTPAGVLLNDAQTAESLKAVIKNLETSTQKLDENMEALQHNFLLRGFFKKKKKAESL
ncbi:MAG TPA: MlaD family protein [Flavisolibacter sp.]|nr:MlaD family protein [Flavisolibacter sp.]